MKTESFEAEVVTKQDSQTTSLAVFDFKGHQVRVVKRDGSEWWVAKDVCDVLDIGNVTDAMSRLDPDEIDTVEVIDSIGRKQGVRAVNESGLYSLVLTSRKPEAKAFKKWITAKVLPELRRTGSYSIPGSNSQATQLALLSQKIDMLVSLLSNQQNEIEQLKQERHLLTTSLTIAQHPAQGLLGYYGAKSLTSRITELRDAINANISEDAKKVHYNTVDKDIRDAVDYNLGPWEDAPRAVSEKAWSIVRRKIDSQRRRNKRKGPVQTVLPLPRLKRL